ncbi:hypothetical protein RUM44_010206 [Polyplax serrata]|uniref:Uncharacterized protein n=1 Tax=Polyplax serrata TaxID=468196 RepID=A0ABR1AUW7_POLSC
MQINCGRQHAVCTAYVTQASHGITLECQRTHIRHAWETRVVQSSGRQHPAFSDCNRSTGLCTAPDVTDATSSTGFPLREEVPYHQRWSNLSVKTQNLISLLIYFADSTVIKLSFYNEIRFSLQFKNNRLGRLEEKMRAHDTGLPLEWAERQRRQKRTRPGQVRGHVVDPSL